MGATTGQIDFDHLGVADALKRHRLTVPLHQREYSWKEKEVKELFSDVSEAIQEQKTAYFLGTIVLTRAADGALQVVDGQQRLATTTILLGAIRDRFIDLNDDILVQSLEEFLFIIDRDRRERVPRLSLNVDDNDYFRKRIILPPNDRERKKCVAQKASHRLINDAAELAQSQVDEMLLVRLLHILGVSRTHLGR